jgi:hypothetical protein
LSEYFLEGARNAARKHVILVHSTSSSEAQPLFQSQDNSITHADKLYHKLSGRMLLSNLANIRLKLKQKGIQLTSSLQDNLIADAVNGSRDVKKNGNWCNRITRFKPL